MPHLPRSVLVAGAGLALLTVLAAVAFLTGHEGLGGTALALLVAGVGLMVVETRARTLRSVRRTEQSVRASAAAMEQAARRTLDRTAAVERRVLVALEKQAVEQEERLARLSREAVEAARAAEDGIRAVDRSVADVRRELDFTRRHLDLAMYRTEQDVEASAQLLRMIEPRAGMPPTGAWAINARNLLHVAQLLRTHRPRRVLELGSGSSTVWLGYLLELVDGELVSLDHLAEYADRTREMLREHALQDRATVQDAPLVPVPVGAGTYQWYDRSALRGTADVGFVIVDGPPKATGPDARYPAVPLLVEHLADEAWIVVDDADRPDETHAVERWLHEVPGLERLPSPTDELAVLHYVRGSARAGSAARTPAT